MTNWGKAQPAPKALWTLVHAYFPQVRNLGIYNDRNVAGTKKKSGHAEGRAIDLGLLAGRPSEKALGDQLFRILISTHQELGLDHVIWNRQIWSQTRGGPRRHTGTSAHTDHLHVEFTRHGSQNTEFPKTTLLLGLLLSGLVEAAQGNANVA